jgi:hypothetical protein
MSRMGHSSTRAARIYLHAREERDKQLAATLDKMARRELRRSRSTKAERPSENRYSQARSGREAARRSLDDQFPARGIPRWTWNFRGGAGDENRTRTISLGI